MELQLIITKKQSNKAIKITLANQHLVQKIIEINMKKTYMLIYESKNKKKG